MKRTVVIVDDSSFLLNMLRAFFEDVMGYEVLATGTNGVQAVDLYRRHKPDLLTLDITMPVKDGKAALSEVLAEFPAARILVISAVTGSAMLECVKAGAGGYVEKPLRFEDEEFQAEFRQSLEEIFMRGTR